ENPESDVYEAIVKFKADASLAALRLEALPHELLPEKGSSRANDGVFRLSEFEAELVDAPADEGLVNANGSSDKEAPPKKAKDPAKPKALKFTRAVATAFAAGREIDKAIDGKADTGWGVEAAASKEPQVALFALAEPIRVQKNMELRMRLRYEASKSRRAIGHFRLAAAQNDDLVQLLNPPKTEPWQVVGPFK